MTTQTRRAVCADDPPEVFVLEAKLLMEYSSRIGEAVDDILRTFPDPEAARAAATAYVAKIGANIPDETIRAAVERLAANKFRLRGIG